MKNILKISTLAVLFFFTSCNQNCSKLSKDQKDILAYTEKNKISFNQFQKLMSENSTLDNENCVTCETPCYNDISREQINEWVNNYQTYDLPKLETGDKAPAKNTKYVMINLNQFEQYICDLKRVAKVKNMDMNNLGLRMYFIKYSESEEYSNMLSAAFVPTYWSGTSTDGVHQDFDSTILKEFTKTQSGLFLPGSNEECDRQGSGIANRFKPCPQWCGGSSFGIQ